VDSKMVDLNEFFDFYEYVVTRVETLRNMMQELQDAPPPTTREEMHKRLNKIDAIRQTLDSLYTEDESTSTVVQMTELLRTLRKEGELEGLEGDTKELLSDLQDALSDLRDLNDTYFDTLIPMTTYTLASYASPEAAAQIEAEKKRVQESGDLTGFRPVRLGISRAMSIPEFKELNAEYFNRKKTDDPMSREEFNEKAMAIKLRYLESKMVGTKQLTQELKEARKSKSVFSYWLDPIVYSLQLFALAVKDALYKANDDTINFTYELAPRYEEFKEFVGGSEFNQEELNDALLTTTKVRRGGQTIEVLSLVQQFDVDRYYSDYYKAMKDLAKKFNKPGPKASKEDWTAWYRSAEANQFYEAKALWFAQNTQPVGGEEAAQAKYQAVLDEQNSIEERIRQLEAEANPRNREQILLLRADYYKLDARRKKMAAFVTTPEGAKLVFMGELAQPNKSYESEKWKTIDQTPELKKYYDFIVKEYHKAQAKIGNNQQQVNHWDKYSYIMPTIRKDGLGTLVEDGWKELLKEKGRDFSRLDTDTEYGLMTEVDGQEIRGIPKYYTQPADQKNVSRDLAASITQFVHMANNYEQKSAIAGLVHSMLVIHEKKGVIKQEKGLPVRDQVANLSRRANELVIRRDVGDNKDLAHLQDFIDTVFYGVTDTTGDIGGLSVGKTVGKLTGTTALVGLAGNLLQIGNQAVLDNLMTAQEAFTKQFFSAEDWAAAGAEYVRNLGALGDAGANPVVMMALVMIARRASLMMSLFSSPYRPGLSIIPCMVYVNMSLSVLVCSLVLSICR
jgi:chemotaxis protein histidine kinase CheA